MTIPFSTALISSPSLVCAFGMKCRSKTISPRLREEKISPEQIRRHATKRVPSSGLSTHKHIGQQSLSIFVAQEKNSAIRLRPEINIFDFHSEGTFLPLSARARQKSDQSEKERKSMTTNDQVLGINNSRPRAHSFSQLIEICSTSIIDTALKGPPSPPNNILILKAYGLCGNALDRTRAVVTRDQFNGNDLVLGV